MLDLERQPAAAARTELSEVLPVSAGGNGLIERVTRPERLEALLPHWRALAETAFLPSISQEPAWILPAWSEFPHKSLETIAVWGADDGAAETRELIGLVTVRAARWHWGLPSGPLRSMVNPHVFDGTPMLHRAHAAEALTELFRQVPEPLLFDSVPKDGSLLEALDEALAASGRRSAWFDAFSRGVLTAGRTSQDYLLETHSRGRRNKFRRWRKQLGELGALELVSLARGEDLESWWREFLDLEAAGWKGRSGTAVASSPADTRFFRRAIGIMHDEGRLEFWKLALDGKAVAMMFATRHDRHLSLGKITFDEDYARFSPGALMLLDIMDWAHERGDTDFIDPCGRPGNKMIDALWKERLEVADCMISAPGCSKSRFDALCAMEGARRTLRRAAKSALQRTGLRARQAR